MDVSGRVAGHVAADPVVVDAVAHAEAVGDDGGEAAQADGGAGEGAGGQDVVVDGRVRRVLVQAVEGLPFSVGQVAHGEEVAVESLTLERRGGEGMVSLARRLE